MKLPKASFEQLAARIQERAIEVAGGEEDHDEVIPIPAIIRLRKPHGPFGIHWALADHQNSRGLQFVRMAAAETSAQWDVHPE